MKFFFIFLVYFFLNTKNHQTWAAMFSKKKRIYFRVCSFIFNFRVYNHTLYISKSDDLIYSTKSWHSRAAYCIAQVLIMFELNKSLIHTIVLSKKFPDFISLIML